MSTENSDQTNLSEKKDFLVNSSSLKDVRSFSREVFEKFKINEDLREELVLAIAEAAQNIVKHAYKDYPDTQDRMAVRISCTDKELEFSFFDKVPFYITLFCLMIYALYISIGLISKYNSRDLVFYNIQTIYFQIIFCFGLIMSFYFW